MGTSTLISPAEYLHKSYEGPEPDFVDGEIIPRAMPNSFHSRAVRKVMYTLFRQAPDALFPEPELRLLVEGGRGRVADLAIFDHEPAQAVPEHMPLAVVEVLSPNDIMAEQLSKFSDYASAGIPHIWLVDPMDKRFWVYRDESLIATPRLELPEYSVVITATDVF